MSKAAAHQEKLEKLDMEEINHDDTDAEATLEEGGDVESPLPSNKHQRPLNKQRSGMLSATSKKFDLNGKGYLDNIEKAMRDMDTDNDGQLELHQIYKVLQEHNETQKRFFRVKRVLMAVSVMTVVLALSNLAMAFVAVELSKDFRPDAQGQLVTTSSGQMVQTQAVGEVGDMERVVVNERMLEEEEDADVCATGSTLFGRMSYETASYIFDLAKKGCRLMLRYRQDGEIVHMTIPYRNVVLRVEALMTEMRFLLVDDVTAVATPSYTFSCMNNKTCSVCEHDFASQTKDEVFGSR